MTELPRILLQHPLGNEFCRALLKGLCDQKLLARFNTGIATYPGNLWGRLSKLSAFGELKRREFPACVAPYTKQYPLREGGRLLGNRLGVQSLTKHEVGVFSVDRVFQHLDRKTAKQALTGKYDAVYCYEDGAYKTFREIKRSKTPVTCLYDLPIGYWRSARKYLKVEVERWPEWQSTMPAFRDSQEKLDRKDEELRLADHIFVASSFTKSTLQDCPFETAKVDVVPYGFPAVGPEKETNGLESRPLKVLYVGGLTQRKGLADVFAVHEQLKADMELTVLGRGNTKDCKPLRLALNQVNWIESAPHSEVIRIMREHDVLVFPSLFEGFGLVITEAMSQGTPVITTDRTAGADLIRHGHNGWLIEASSTEALKTQVEELLNQKQLIVDCGINARLTASQRPWSTYGAEMAHRITEALEAQ